MPTGTFTKKTQRQERLAVSRPPSGEPTATPSAPAVASRPKVRPMRSGGSRRATALYVMTTMTDPPVPCTQRAATSRTKLGASAPSREPATNTA